MRRQSDRCCAVDFDAEEVALVLPVEFALLFHVQGQRSLRKETMTVRTSVTLNRFFRRNVSRLRKFMVLLTGMTPPVCEGPETGRVPVGLMDTKGWTSSRVAARTRCHDEDAVSVPPASGREASSRVMWTREKTPMRRRARDRNRGRALVHDILRLTYASATSDRNRGGQHATKLGGMGTVSALRGVPNDHKLAEIVAYLSEALPDVPKLAAMRTFSLGSFTAPIMTVRTLTAQRHPRRSPRI